MKKIILFLTVLCLISSCSETIVLDESISLKSLESEPLSKRSAKEAIAIALQARTDFGLTKSRSADKVLSVVALPTLSSRAESVDTSLYVVNFDDDGFAIVSTNPKYIGLLAITENGYIGSLDEIDNPGLKQFIYTAGRYIPEDSVTGCEEINVEIVDTLAFSQVAPRITTKWGQQWPAGYYCPNGICGCVPLALAQTLAYFEMPNSISYSYANKDIESQNLNWHNIKYSVNSLNSPTTYFDVDCYSYEYSTLARVCRELGHRLDAYYGIYGTGAYPCDIKTILPSLTSELTSSEVYYHNPGSEDFGEGIIIISGTDTSNGGHTWILDGYKEWTLHYYT